MLSFPLLGRSRSFAVPAKVTLTCFFALVGLAVFVLGTALSPAQAQYPGGGYPGGGSGSGYPGGSSGGGYPGTTGTGHYDVSYSVTAGSGSTATYTTSGYPGSGASVSATDSKSCYTSYGSSPTTYHIAANSALTATFTWNNENNPANLPPSCTIINQGSSASWSAQAQGCVPTGDCDPGLPNPVYTSGYLSKSGTATLYTVKSGSGGLSSITLAPVTPTASSDGTSGSAGGSGANGTVNVSYTASATPVTISLAGTIKDSSGNLNILVGQGCTASLVGVPSNCTVSNYNWTIPGTTFQDWGPSSPLSPNASYFIGGPGPLTNPTAHWYWNDSKQAQETVTCTATVTPPAGQGTPFSITVTQKVTVQVPDWDAAGIGGYMQVNTSAPRYGGYSLWAGPVASTRAGLPGGMNWQAKVYTPTTPAFGTGTFELVQIVTPSDSYTTLTNPVQNHSDLLNGQTGLDVTYPYGVVWSEPAKLQDNDSPGLHLTGLGQSGNLTAASAVFQSSFVDYLMYQPPSSGNGVKWVPLAAFTWSTNGNATVPVSGNWADYVTQNFSDSAGTVTPSTNTPFSPWNTHPSWTNKDVSHSY